MVGSQSRLWRRTIDRFPPWLESLSTRAFYTSVVVTYLLLVFIRAPSVFISRRMWAEEATIYYDFAVQHNFVESIGAIHLGYFSLLPNLFTWLAAKAPLGIAPLITTASAALIQLSLVLLVLMARFETRRPRFSQMLVAIAFAFGFPQTEVWLTTINLQWYLIISTAVILAADVRCGAYRMFSLTALATAALSGPGSAFMAPLFLLRALVERSRLRIEQMLLFCIFSTLQMLVVLTHFDAGGTSSGAIKTQVRSMSFDAYPLALSSVLRSFVVPLTGPDFGYVIGYLARSDSVLFSLAGQAAILAGSLLVSILIIRGRISAAYWMMASALIVSGLTAYGALGSGSIWDQVSVWHHRYTFPATTIVGIALAIVATGTGAGAYAGLLARVGFAIYLLWGIVSFGFGSIATKSLPWRSGPDWCSQIDAWKSDTARGIAIWPEGWIYHPSFASETMPGCGPSSPR